MYVCFRFSLFKKLEMYDPMHHHGERERGEEDRRLAGRPLQARLERGEGQEPEHLLLNSTGRCPIRLTAHPLYYHVSR